MYDLEFSICAIKFLKIREKSHGSAVSTYFDINPTCDEGDVHRSTEVQNAMAVGNSLQA